jgi:hypothetical protein
MAVTYSVSTSVILKGSFYYTTDISLANIKITSTCQIVTEVWYRVHKFIALPRYFSWHLGQMESLFVKIIAYSKENLY